MADVRSLLRAGHGRQLYSLRPSPIGATEGLLASVHCARQPSLPALCPVTSDAVLVKVVQVDQAPRVASASFDENPLP
jgi:hypothetical protein